MEIETRNINEKLSRLAKDVELIKNILMSEGELSDWAVKELAKARNRSRTEKLSNDEVKKRILAK